MKLTAWFVFLAGVLCMSAAVILAADHAALPAVPAEHALAAADCAAPATAVASTQPAADPAVRVAAAVRMPATGNAGLLPNSEGDIRAQTVPCPVATAIAPISAATVAAPAATATAPAPTATALPNLPNIPSLGGGGAPSIGLPSGPGGY